MEATYFIEIEATPTEQNKNYEKLEGAYVNVWTIENSPEEALFKTTLEIQKYDWEIKNIKTPPTECVRDNFVERDLGLQNFDEAQEEGIALTFVAWARDGKSSFGPERMSLPYETDINKFFSIVKKQKNTGYCLHYDANEGCKQIVKAHSIQKKQALDRIACNGHVYRIMGDIGTLKNSDKATCKKIGIKKASIFLGFCKKHDNELFEAIDNYPLDSTNHQQAFLYGYRSLCREVFVKRNSLVVTESQLSREFPQKVKEFFLSFKEGTSFGLKNLIKHKNKYDKSLKKKQFQDIEYVIFKSAEKPSLLFSGLLYPDFDFMGRRLQDLSNHSKDLELITFCSAPTEAGWGFLFSWHASSSNICQTFVQSLATMVYEGRKLEDLLFRLVVSTCENHAISPQWWESLSLDDQKQIIVKFSLMLNVINPYLSEGLEGITDWKFDEVFTSY